jgi:hypothetical protein
MYPSREGLAKIIFSPFIQTFFSDVDLCHAEQEVFLNQQKSFKTQRNGDILAGTVNQVLPEVDTPETNPVTVDVLQVMSQVTGRRQLPPLNI